MTSGLLSDHFLAIWKIFLITHSTLSIWNIGPNGSSQGLRSQLMKVGEGEEVVLGPSIGSQIMIWLKSHYMENVPYDLIFQGYVQ